MKLVKQTEIASAYFGDFTAIRIIKNAGFDGLDYSMFTMKSDDCILNSDDYKSYVAKLKASAKELGIEFLQSHAPFPCYTHGDDVYNGKIFPRIVRSIEISAELGIPYIVVHPIGAYPPNEDKKEFNLNFYKKLRPYAKEYGVRICIENMWGYDNKRGYIIPNICSTGAELADFYDSLDSECFAVCLDLGHCGLIGEEPEHAIRVLGKDRLHALHVHDNDYKHDSHTLPFMGKMNWNAITGALKDINYQGNFTYEADCFFTGFDHDEELFTSATRLMHDVGRYLINKIEG
ncbi:MAG: sugar phosphate isomerase/epimerase family protein [Bacillota bacterium]|nr:sugar phosphate isomerase/epimerase family protein [Bacillota bacterium]